MILQEPRYSGKPARRWYSFRPEVIAESQMDRIYDTLHRIRQLWEELEQTKPKTSEYEALMEKIRTLSDEYRALIDAPKKPQKSK